MSVFQYLAGHDASTAIAKFWLSGCETFFMCKSSECLYFFNRHINILLVKMYTTVNENIE